MTQDGEGADKTSSTCTMGGGCKDNIEFEYVSSQVFTAVKIWIVVVWDMLWSGRWRLLEDRGITFLGNLGTRLHGVETENRTNVNIKIVVTR
jgi:hypothetical protein